MNLKFKDVAYYILTEISGSLYMCAVTARYSSAILTSWSYKALWKNDNTCTSDVVAILHATSPRPPLSLSLSLSPSSLSAPVLLASWLSSEKRSWVLREIELKRGRRGIITHSLHELYIGSEAFVLFPARMWAHTPLKYTWFTAL